MPTNLKGNRLREGLWIWRTSEAPERSLRQPDRHGTEYGIPVPRVSSPAEAKAVVDALVAEGAEFIG